MILCDLPAMFSTKSLKVTEMTDYQQEIKDLTVTRSLRFLCNGFKSDFATAVFSDERTIELFGQLASEFVDANIPVIDEDNQMELAMMLLESLDVIAR
jgi:hypothetical protein